MKPLAQNPGERAKWQVDVEGATTKAVEEIVRTTPSERLIPPRTSPCRPAASGARVDVVHESTAVWERKAGSATGRHLD